MKTIEYHPDGEKYSDHECESAARKMLCSTESLTMTSNEHFITAVRVFVKEGLIPHTEVRFLFNRQEILIDRNGRLEAWPHGFCDLMQKMLFRLL